MGLVKLCTTLVFCIIFFGTNIQYQEYAVKNRAWGKAGEWRFNAPILIFVAFVLVLTYISGVRHGYVDTFAYKEMYLCSRNNLSYVNSAPYGVEAGWLYFCYFLNFISPSPNLLLLVSALFITATYAVIIRRYSFDPLFSLVIFYCILYMDTNNGLRQMVAAAITMWGFIIIEKLKIWRIALCVGLIILAYQLHESSFIIVVFLVISYGKPWNLRMCMFFTFGFLFFFSPGFIKTFLEGLFSDSKYINYLNMSNGMGIMRAIITGFIPLIVGVYYCNIRNNYGDGKYEMTESRLLNMMFINSLLVIMGLKMQYWNRIGFYTAFAPIVMMPRMLNELFIKEQRGTIKALVCLLYFIFFAYNIYVNIGYGAIPDFYYDFTPLFGG